MLLPRLSLFNLVKKDSADTSNRLLLPRYSHSNLVKEDSADTSLMMLLPRLSLSNLVKEDSADTSLMMLPGSHSTVRLVKEDSADTSLMLLLLRYSTVRLVKEDSADTSLMLFFSRSSTVRLVACSRPVKSLIPESRALRRVKVAISAGVIGAPLALPKLSSITAHRFASGMLTPELPPSGGGPCSQVVSNTLTKSTKSEILIIPFLSISISPL